MSMPQGSRLVVVVDDYAEVASAIGALLRAFGYETLAFTSAEALLKAGVPAHACCLLLDLSLPGMDGVALLTKLRSEGCSVPALLVSGVGNIRLAVRALHAGAMDFIEKPYAPEQLVAAVRACEAARFQPKIALPLKLREQLTGREREVMESVVDGLSSKEIGAKLGISPRTVEIHRSNMMAKVGASNTASLLRIVFAASPPR